MRRWECVTVYVPKDLSTIPQMISQAFFYVEAQSRRATS